MEGQLDLDIFKEQNKRYLIVRRSRSSKEETEDSKLLLDAEKMKHDIKMARAELVLEERQGRNVSIGQ